MNRDETEAFFLECESKRAATLAGGNPAHAHEAAKAHWNKRASMQRFTTDFSGYVFAVPTGVRLDFRGFIFPGKTSFDSAIFNGSTLFDSAKFDGDASFDHAEFGEDSLFVNTTFESYASFHSAIFKGSTEFFQTAFKNRARFGDSDPKNRTTFKGDASFFGAEFGGVAEFENAQFELAADFSNVRFKSTASFDNAFFKDSAWFTGAKFEGNAMFSDAILEGNTNFHSAVFTNSTSFRDARFEAEGKKADADFIAIKVERAFDLTGARFSKVPNFCQADFKQAPDLDRVYFPLPPAEPLLSGDKDLVPKYRAIRRMAIQGADYDREQMAFKGEVRSRRWTTDKAWHPGLWLGILYDVFADCGRSISRPASLWLSSVLTFAILFVRAADQGGKGWAECVARGDAPILKALYISGRNALVLSSGGKDDRITQAYQCLFGGADGKLSIPDGVSIVESFVQVPLSAVLIFLFLLAVNRFKIK